MTSTPEGRSTGSAHGPRSAADERWDRAVSIASGRPTSSAAADRRRRRNRFWTLLVALTVAGLATGVVAVLILGSPADQDSPSATREHLQLTMTVLALVLMAVGITVSIRAGQWGGPWRAALTALDRSQRRQVLRVVRGKDDLDGQHPERVPVHLDLASRLAQPWGFLLLMFGVALNVVGMVIGGDGPPGLPVLAAVLVVVYAVGLVPMLRDQRAAQRFLDEHSSAPA